MSASGIALVGKTSGSGVENGAVIGKHVYGNLYGVPYGNLTDAARLTFMVKEAAGVGKAHIIDTMVKKFEARNGIEGGVSIIALLEESHISLHTWPEGDYATIDVYTCGAEADPDVIFNFMIDWMKPKHFKVFRSDRSLMKVGNIAAR